MADIDTLGIHTLGTDTLGTDTLGTDTLGTVDVNVGVTLAAPRLRGAVARRLFELGLRPGTEVVVLHRTAGGGRVVSVDGARVALDRATLGALPVIQRRPVTLRTPQRSPA